MRPIRGNCEHEFARRLREADALLASPAGRDGDRCRASNIPVVAMGYRSNG